jgi:hypothetical protein
MDLSSIHNHVQSFVVASPGISIIVVMVSLIGLIRYFAIYRSRRLYFPTVGNGVELELKNDLMEGARKVLDVLRLEQNHTDCIRQYPEEPFIIPVSPPMVVLPECVLDEVRFLSEDKGKLLRL